MVIDQSIESATFTKRGSRLHSRNPGNGKDMNEKRLSEYEEEPIGPMVDGLFL